MIRQAAMTFAHLGIAATAAALIVAGRNARRRPSVTRLRRRASSILALVLATVLPIDTSEAGTADASTSRTVRILLQDIDERGCDGCGALTSLVISPLLALESSDRRKELARQYGVLGQRLPELDIPGTVRAAFCRHLSKDGTPDCPEVEIVGLVDQSRGHAVADPATNILIVRLSIEYTRLMRFNELRIIAAFVHVDGNGAVGRPFLYAWYTTPGADATPANPLGSSAKTETAKQRAAREHWFSGAPTRMEREVRAGLEEIAAMSAAVLPQIEAADPKAVDTWLNSLKSLADVQSEGNFNCRGAACRMRTLGVAGDRIRTVQEANAVVVMSAPLDTLR